MRGSSQNAVPAVVRGYRHCGVVVFFFSAEYLCLSHGSQRDYRIKGVIIKIKEKQFQGYQEGVVGVRGLGIERREETGDQAYAPFGAGRETGHQVPVVAAKIESDRYRESRNTLCRGEKEEGEEARVK